MQVGLNGHGVENGKADALTKSPPQRHIQERTLDIPVMNNRDTATQAGKQILKNVFQIRCLVDIAVGDTVDRNGGPVQGQFRAHDPVPGLGQPDPVQRKGHQTDTDNRMLVGIEAGGLKVDSHQRNL